MTLTPEQYRCWKNLQKLMSPSCINAEVRKIVEREGKTYGSAIVVLADRMRCL